MSISRLILLIPFALAACGEKDTDDSAPTDDSAAADDTGEAAAAEYGPDNGWPHALVDELPEGLAGTGWYEGDVAYNFTLQDQHGDEVELYQFYGKLIVLDVFAEWCGPCQQLAPDGEEVWQELSERGVVYLALMQEDVNANAPTPETALRWAETYGLTHPVVADSSASQGEYATIGGGFPTFPVIGPDMVLLTNDLYPPNIADVEALLDQVGM